MLINVNGVSREITQGTTVEKLLQEIGSHGPQAVELNRKICPKRKHGETVLQNSDIIEIVTIVGGG